MRSTSEQVILITGASSGIGAALAEALARQFLGVRLVLSGRNPQRLEAVAEHCSKAGAKVLSVATDITDAQQANGLAQKALSHFGRVDVLVNNAGYGQMGPVELVSDAAVRRQMDVNFFGPLTLIRALVPAMRAAGGGRIVNLSSLAGQVASPFSGIYSASKYALEAISDALRMELAPFGISVVLIEPGPVSTEFFKVAQQQAEGTIADPKQTVYAPAFEKLEGIVDQVDKVAWPLERATQVIVKAVTDRRPRARYVAAPGGALLLPLLNLLPAAVKDRLQSKFYGLDRIAGPV
ncbi:SDR family oxidoreductase [Leptolyngbya sp. FACHB-261]|uniref:SDR family oxidoreductase n=1 Tax=Leptolyngbya sp. FACHB-261 TaxID=2692806 RepID=UPI0016825C90|nr:SDR family oxidoreductase [Leptolyngbya sp. FACHB-261]MBD2100669.1 SDR family oxidoreductase [Leptolyngbya sp. FACHB-261]